MRKIYAIIAIILLSISSFLAIYMVKKMRDHNTVSDYLIRSIVDYNTFIKNYPKVEADLIKAANYMTLEPKILFWDTARLKPYLKNIKLINTPSSVIIYYDNNSTGIIDLLDVDFMDYYLVKPNIKYFEFKKSNYVIAPDDFVHFDLIVYKNNRRAKNSESILKEIKNFHAKFLGFEGKFTQNSVVYLQIRKYKGTPVYDIIWKKADVTNDEIRNAFNLLNKEVLMKYKDDYDIMNVPLAF